MYSRYVHVQIGQFSRNCSCRLFTRIFSPE